MAGKIRQLGIAVMALLAVAACSDGPTEPTLAAGASDARAGQSQKAAESPTIVDVAVEVNAETGEFTTLLAAVTAAGLVDDLAAVGQRTVFAPTDAAFAAAGLDETNVADAFSEEQLLDILLYHVSEGRLDAAEVTEKDQLRMLNGDFTAITVNDMGAFINESQIVQTDVMASNGIIHVIDGVLLPPADEGPGPDGKPGDDDDYDDEDGEYSDLGTIVDVALEVNAETGEFTTLLAAVTAAGLVDDLAAMGQRTVFAPTDAAFAAAGLDETNVADAFSEEQLLDILLYHVSEGRLDAAEVTEKDQLRMLNGDFTAITVNDMGAFINESQIVQTDVMASNGIIHVIDGVLLPPADEGPGPEGQGGDGDDYDDDGDDD